MVAIIVVIVATIAGYVLFMRPVHSQDTDAQATVARLQKEIGKVLMLPAGETPNTYQINDTSSLKSNSFYDNAQKGDYLLVYPKASVAILYREKDHLLVNVDHVALTTK